MSSVLYLHHGGGRPAFYLGGRPDEEGEPLHGSIVLRGGVPIVVSATPLSRSFSVRELEGAGYRKVCEVDSPAGFREEAALADEVVEAILAWLTSNVREREDCTPAPRASAPEPAPASSNADAWNW